ncbi:hypothetical protein ON010_g60 [Phytophthora cinnamomi]|nr:hypothetical protein ON010_g60 [Phytophthora cinnamomi]
MVLRLRTQEEGLDWGEDYNALFQLADLVFSILFCLQRTRVEHLRLYPHEEAKSAVDEESRDATFISTAAAKRAVRLTAGATTVAGASRLHEVLLQIHNDKSERREKRYKCDAELREQQLQQQKEQLELQRKKFACEEKMDQQFALLS